jgi:hypothetical protein
LSTRAIGTSDPLAPVRYLDVGLVILTVPFLLIAGLPPLGCLVGAGVWILQRAIAVAAERRAAAAGDYRASLGLTAASLMVRVWLVALAILTVGLAGDREDGRVAGILVLAAFTVYLAISLLTRASERTPNRP